VLVALAPDQLGLRIVDVRPSELPARDREPERRKMLTLEESFKCEGEKVPVSRTPPIVALESTEGLERGARRLSVLPNEHWVLRNEPLVRQPEPFDSVNR
jgi:hypothetical protein